MSTITLDFRPSADAGPDDLRIPPRPRVMRLDARLGRGPAWREAMRWWLFGLTASVAAGELALAWFGP